MCERWSQTDGAPISFKPFSSDHSTCAGSASRLVNARCWFGDVARLLGPGGGTDWPGIGALSASVSISTFGTLRIKFAVKPLAFREVCFVASSLREEARPYATYHRNGTLAKSQEMRALKGGAGDAGAHSISLSATLS